MDEEWVPQHNHFHIRWQGVAKLDWQRFDSPEEAGERAKELARRDELFAIEEFNGDCPQCGTHISQAFRRLS